MPNKESISKTTIESIFPTQVISTDTSTVSSIIFSTANTSSATVNIKAGAVTAAGAIVPLLEQSDDSTFATGVEEIPDEFLYRLDVESGQEAAATITASNQEERIGILGDDNKSFKRLTLVSSGGISVTISADVQKEPKLIPVE